MSGGPPPDPRPPACRGHHKRSVPENSVIASKVSEYQHPAIPIRKTGRTDHNMLWSFWTTNATTFRPFSKKLLLGQALVYKWWHLYARLHDGAHHREAITSRPALLGGVARLMRHGGQRTVKVSLQHEDSAVITQSIALVSNTLRRFHLIAERWNPLQRWTLLLTYIFRHWVGWKMARRTPTRGRPAASP